MMIPVRVGLIGCGSISGRHVRALLKKPQCTIPVICDVSEHAAQECKNRIRSIRSGAHPLIVSDYRDLLSKNVRGVVLLVPPALHYPIAMAAFEAGKHVLVEKPVAVSTTEAGEMIDAARRAGKILAVAYQRAYIPHYLYVRRMVRNGELGTIRFITAHLEQGWFQKVSSDGPDKLWKIDGIHSGGGQLFDTGNHILAALLHVTGLEPVEVYARIDRCGLDVDVNTAMVVRFDGEAQAAVTIGGFGHSMTESLRVVGEAASVRIFSRTVKEQVLEVNGIAVDAAKTVAGSDPDTNFIDAIEGKAEPEADAALGARVVRLCEAAHESAREGTPVKV